MALRELLRGRISWDRLEAVGGHLADRYEEPVVRVACLDADNWLSTPLVVNERYFVKVITDQHALVHALLTTGRNLGAVSSGAERFFEHVAGPIQMAEREYDATRAIRDLGVNVPDPVEWFAFDDDGILVYEYLEDFETVDELDADRATVLGPRLFEALETIHGAGIAHGDLRAENVLVSDGELYFIDATSVSESIESARAYDVACALAALAPLLGPTGAVAAADDWVDPATLRRARAFLDFVNIRPDHDFDARALKRAINAALD